MRDARTLLIALLLATPFACSHDERGAASPTRGTAGSDLNPAPSTTEEPNVPGVPSALNAPTRSGPAARAFDDSRTTIEPNAVAQPMPSPGSGGTIGTGGSGPGAGTGGIGPGAGTGGISTGGSIVH